MSDFISLYAEPAFYFLLKQSLAATPLFLLALSINLVFPYNYAKLRHGLWTVFMLRLVIPLEVFLPNLWHLQNPLKRAHIDAPVLETLYEPNFFTGKANTIPSTVSVSTLIFAMLSVIFFFLVLRSIYSYFKIYKLNKNSIFTTETSILRRLSYWQQKLKIKSAVRIKFSDKTQSAVTVGLIKASIIFPTTYRSYSLAELDMIIAHECMHIKRKDNLRLLLQLGIHTIYFFNPLVWIANRFLNISREQICDTSVLQHSTILAKFYGTVLINSLYQPGMAAVNSGFNIHQFTIKLRLKTLFRSQKMKRKFIIPIIISAFILSAFSLQDALPKTKETKAGNEKIEFTQPLKTGKITAKFGKSKHPVLEVMRTHTAIDVAAAKGTNIFASADGQVSFAGNKGGWGNLIIIEHKDNYQTRYAHLDEIKVEEGQSVKRGDEIGTVGNTGVSTGPHLHYEIRKDSTALDPQKFINFVF